MIKDQKEYQVSLEWLNSFERSLKALSKDIVKKTKEPEAWQIQYDGVKSMWNSVKEEVTEYEALLKHDRSQPIYFEFPEIDGIAKVLIQARIAFKITQYELAYICGLTEESIKIYEEQEYQNARFTDVITVSDALGLKPISDGLIAEIDEFYQQRLAAIRSSECLAS